MSRFYKISAGPIHLPHEHQENEEAVWAHFTSLRAEWSGVEWSEVEPEYCSENFWSLLLMS